MIYKKILFIISICAVSLTCSSADLNNKSSSVSIDENIRKPEIIEVFACSDNCPDPREQYIVKAYKGILNAAECSRIGGRSYEYFGWTKYFVCIAE